MSNKPHEQPPFRVGPKSLILMDWKTQGMILAGAVAVTTWCLHVNAGLAGHDKVLAEHTVTLSQIQELQRRDDAKLNALLNNKAGLSKTTEAVASAIP